MESNLKIINFIVQLFILGLLFAWCFILIRPFIIITLWGVFWRSPSFPFFWGSKTTSGDVPT